jgi:hypothetical protein
MLKHRCKDGQATKLERHGPVGTMVEVTFSCPRCGWTQTAEVIKRESLKAVNAAFGLALK